MTSEPVHYLSLMNVSRRLRSGELKPTTLTETVLARIARHDGTLKSYTTLLADRGALGDQEYRQPGDSVLLKEGQPAVVPQILTQNALLSELDRGQYNVFAKRH